MAQYETTQVVAQHWTPSCQTLPYEASRSHHEAYSDYVSLSPMYALIV